MIDLVALQAEVHALARTKGWWDPPPDGPGVSESKLALIHSEVSEALECIRRDQLDHRTDDRGKPCGLPSELADVVIRCLDYAAAYGTGYADGTDAGDARELGAQMAADQTTWPQPTPTAAGRALFVMHGELHRDGGPDVITLIAQCYMFAAWYSIDLDQAILSKHAFNATREHLHGGRAL